MREYSPTAAANCSNGDIRLVGGQNLREGRVELCYRGLWGTVDPGDDWGYTEAAVVCRELGYDTLGKLAGRDLSIGRFMLR